MSTIEPRTFSLSRWPIFALLVLSLAGASIHAQELGQWSFADGTKGWTAVNQATVSDISRRPGGKSLLIRQHADAEANSAWLSPVMANPGKPVCVSVWAADNYETQQDASYAASFEMVPCNKDGTLTSLGGDWTYMPWEDKRQIQQFRHDVTPAGLQWKNYAAVKDTTGEFFRVRLCWPKPLMRGECYITDVQVSVADATTTAATSTAAASASSSRHTLEISCAASGNLFYSDDQLRFEFLLYSTDGKPVGTLTKPELRYDITDYEHFRVAAGTLDFAPAAPVTLAQLAPARAQNLRLSALLPDAAAKGVGREFFLRAQLVADGKVVAEDTVTYAVVAPRQTAAKDLSKSRFIAFSDGTSFRDETSKHAEQSVTAKMGVSLTQTWDYSGWRDAQPVKGGPITIARGPDFPKLVYCPNLEQIRGRNPDHPWGDVSKNAPDWAVNDDPFHPGCKGFEIDGYVAYIVAYVRANRHRIVQVVPSGLERSIDVRTLELHRKAYAAIKAEFPDLPVGMMTWGMPDSAYMIDLIMKEKLYEVADFFDTHVYQSGVGWTESDRLERELKKLGITRRMISTEFANVGGCDQLEGSRSIIASMLDAHAHGMDRITYFLMHVHGAKPVLRGEFGGDGFAWMQYVARPRISDAIKDNDWSGGNYGNDRRGTSLMPLLKTTAYYNFVQAVECADFKTVFKPTPRSIAYVYARDGKTICYVFQREPNPPATLALQTSVPYVIQDIYGRNDRVTPSGTSLVVATQDPLVLLFEGDVPALYDPTTAAAALKPVEGGLILPTIARGAAGTATLTIPPVFASTGKLRVAATVDGTWPKLEPRDVTVVAGTGTKLELPIAIAADQVTGTCTFTTRIYDGERLISVLKQPLIVGEVLQAQLAGVPMTPSQDPAIAVTITSLAGEPRSGTVRIANRFFGAGFEPAVMEQPYKVAAHGSVEVRFPIPREQANLAVSYEMRATISDASGFTLTSEDEVSFQACVKTTTPITIDGDLADWHLDKLLPIPYEKQHRQRDLKDFNGRFYTRWDAERLYFAAEITDSVPVVTGVDQVVWNDDNIMFCLYPWGWHLGEPLNAGYYREHLGPIKGGKASFLRVGNVPSGPSTAAGAQIAVKRTATGWIYEWAYPQATMHPIALHTGGAFRVSMSVWDQFKASKKDEADWGEYSWLTFSGFNSSVNAVPSLWRQFTLVE